MKFDELQALVAGGEGPQVEFKRSTGQRTDAAKTTCAMLNGVGGFVLFGVEPNGSLAGQEIGVDTIDDVVHEVRRIEPQVPLAPEVIPLPNGRSAIALSVPGSSGGPYTYDGRPYLRQGTMTLVMGQDDYRRRLLEQMHPSHRWEVQPAVGIGINDLDGAEVSRTVDEAVRRGRLNEPGTRNVGELLQGLNLLRDGGLLNAGVVLFARVDELLPNYPQCLLRMARFRGNTTAEFEDNRQLQGNLFQLLGQAQTFLRQHLPVAGRIVPSLFEREDDPLYPPEALREALANALCHRDYSAGGGSVSIAIFDDRLEITSTGRLPFGLTVEDLVKPHSSRPWNPLMAAVLYRRGLIEQWGRGTLRMRELSVRAGLAPPDFEERGGELVVRFFPTGYVAPRRIDHPLTAPQQQVLETLARLGPSLAGQIQRSTLTRLPMRTLRYVLDTLRTLDLVEVHGRGRGARWKLSGR